MVLSQLNNTAFYRSTPFYANQQGDVRLVLDGLGFTKNNEYFNRFADGYTLFGYQFNPRLAYCLSNTVRLDGGIFIRKDFGAPGIYQAQPTFTIRYQKERSQLVFGTLQGSLNHRYIEPLYDFERVLNQRVENGVQYLYKSPRLWLDSWINWQRMIYKGSPYQEQIAGGVSAEYQAWQSTDSSTRVVLPLQFTAQHHGGQIDATQLSLLTVFNVAGGFSYERHFKSPWLKKIYTANYLTGFHDHSNTYQLHFKNGYGLYVNAGIQTRYQDVMIELLAWAAVCSLARRPVLPVSFAQLHRLGYRSAYTAVFNSPFYARYTTGKRRSAHPSV